MGFNIFWRCGQEKENEIARRWRENPKGNKESLDHRFPEVCPMSSDFQLPVIKQEITMTLRTKPEIGEMLREELVNDNKKSKVHQQAFLGT